MNNIRIPLFVLMLLFGIIVKSPAILLIATFIGLVIFLARVGVLSVESKSKKKAVEAPKVVKIDGVGEVQWVTDPRQLDDKRMWSARELKRMEDQLLDCSTDEWRKEGEKVVLDELEAADKPDTVYERFKAQQRLGKGRTIVTEENVDYVVRVDEREEPIAYISKGRYPQNVIANPLNRPYSGGGIIKLADRRQSNPGWNTDIL